ncbi:conjugative transfer TraA domain protein [Rickettsia bellii str. RML Mogi]|uniref:Conjugative transfer TraA domain protein n=1 Tax=Rickettsia bellii str. RML Mogi TaxID=1359194 RepID=A0A0F3QF20_RICBE|nr:conjugative transfer TraA domain protein [Rickettsia bellii str. RML Mogi]
MREWKSRVELTGNIINLHENIKRCAGSIESIKLDAAGPSLDFELELNIKDLKIDPYSIALSEGQDSFKYIIANILKREQEDNKTIKGVTIGEDKLKINFKELDRRDQSRIIAICLRQSELQEVKNLFEALKLEKNVLKDYASVICDSYHSVIDIDNAEEFKSWILEKKEESKLITESKVEIRAVTREQNFSKSEDRQAKLEEQIGQIQEKLAKHEESLNATASKISTNLRLIQENTTFTSNSVLMGERTIQLNINYETLRKHAGHDTYKYYLQDITRQDTIIHCKAYGDLMLLAKDASGEIVKERESADGNQQISTAQKPISNNTNTTKAINNLNRRIQKDLSSIDSYIFDNQELIELKRGDLLESQEVLSDLKQEQELKENFVETLLPHYLGRIYEQQGAAVIEKWEAVKAANSNIAVKELIERVKSNPSILGKLPGIGLGTIFGVSSSRRKSIEQVSKLGMQLLKYEESMARLNEIKEDDLICEQELKITALEKDLKNLEHLKPSKAEAKFLSSLKAMQAGSGLNIKSFRSLVESDEVQDLICEYYNSQNEKYTRLNATDEEYQDEYQLYSKEQEQQAATHQEKVGKTHSTHRLLIVIAG